MAASLRAAIYERLHDDPTLQGLLGDPDNIYHQRAPADAPSPYLIFSKQTGNPDWTFGTDRADHLQSERWLVKAVCAGGTAGPAEAAADRADELLHDAALTVDTASVLYARRLSDIDYAESSGPDLFHHVGFITNIVVQPL